MSTRPTRIGRYELVDRLGQGGMGTLYLARDPALGRTVAIKLLSVQSEELRERFAREARSAAALKHHNIVTIYDVGEENGQPFIAMEYVDGETLAQVIRRGAPLLPTRKIELAQELCAGLGYAHRAGIVHRDVKPANVMVSTEGVLKLLDFGLARVASDATQAGLTAIGVMVGTPHYMAPEQIEGRAIDRRTDIFAVGLVLYELLSYRKAYPGDSAYAVIHRILSMEPEPLQEICPGLDPDLVSIVGRAIEKDPARRYQDLAAMGADLGRVRHRLLAAATDATMTLGRDDAGSGAVLPERGPGPGVTPRPFNRESIARRRATEIQRHLEAAAARLADGEPDRAVEACEAAALIDPDDPRVVELLQRSHDAVDARQVARLVADGRALLGGGNLSGAEQAADQAATLRADAAEVIALRHDLRRAREERQRREAHDRDAMAAVDEARRLFTDGDHDAALRRLDTFSPPHPAVTEARQAIGADYEELLRRHRDAEAQRAHRAAEDEQRRLVEQRLAAADAARAAGDLAGAIQLARSVLEAQPGHARAAQLLQSIQRTVDDQRKREQLDTRAAQAIIDARRQFAAGQHAAAIKALSQFPAAHPAVSEALAALRDELEGIERARLEQAHRREQQDLERAEAEKRARDEARRHSVESALEEARARLATGDLAGARARVAEALVLAPSHVDALSLREVIDEASRERRAREELERRATRTVEEAQELFRADRTQEALRRLETFVPQYPAVTAALEALRRESDARERERRDQAARAAEASRVRAQSGRPARQRRTLAIAAAALFVAVAAAAVWWAGRGASGPVDALLADAQRLESQGRLDEALGRIVGAEAAAASDPRVQAWLAHQAAAAERAAAGAEARAMKAGAEQQPAYTAGGAGLAAARQARAEGRLAVAVRGFREAAALFDRSASDARARAVEVADADPPGLAGAGATPDALVRQARAAFERQEWTRALDVLGRVRRQAPAHAGARALTDEMVQAARKAATQRKQAAERAGIGAAHPAVRAAAADEQQASRAEGAAAVRAWLDTADGYAAAITATGAATPAAYARLDELVRLGREDEALTEASTLLRRSPGDTRALGAVATLQRRAQAAAEAARGQATSAGADPQWPAEFAAAAAHGQRARGADTPDGAVRAWWDARRSYEQAARQARDAAGAADRASALARNGQRSDALAAVDSGRRSYPGSRRLEEVLLVLYQAAELEMGAAADAARRAGKAESQSYRSAAGEEQQARRLGRTTDAVRGFTRAAESYRAALAAPAPPTAAAAPTPPAAPDPAALRSEVQAVLDSVARAYEEKDMDAINRLLEFMKYESLKTIERDFKEYRSVQWDLSLDRVDTLPDGTVKASCTVRREIDKRSGSDISDTRATVFTLRRSGGAWKIVGQSY